MKKPTWRQWARACIKDPTSPSALTREGLAALTGQDSSALDAIAACWELYARGDKRGQEGALAAVRALLEAMQPSVRWIARELIPFALDWHDRDRLWIQVEPIEVSGLVNSETGAGVDTISRKLVEKLGRAGRLPPKAQAEFDARERS